MLKNKPIENKLIDKAPVLKQRQEMKKKLGLITKYQNTKVVSFRLPLDVIESIKAVAQKANEKTNFQILPTHVMSMVFRYLKKHPVQFMKMMKK